MHWSTSDDFDAHGFPRSMWADKEHVVVDALAAANGIILGYFRTAPNVTLPIAEANISAEMRMYECWIAAFNTVSVIGYDPGSSPDDVILTRYKMAMQWLRDVAAGKTQPIPTAAETPDPDDEDTTDAGAAVYSDTSRVWSSLLG